MDNLKQMIKEEVELNVYGVHLVSIIKIHILLGYKLEDIIREVRSLLLENEIIQGTHFVYFPKRA